MSNFLRAALGATLAAAACGALTPTAGAATPDTFGQAVFVRDTSALPGLGGARPDAIAFAPGGDLLAVRTDAKDVRVAVGRIDAARGRIRQPQGAGMCLSSVPTKGCAMLPTPPRDVRSVVVGAGGRAVHLVGQGVLTLARDPQTGALAPLPGGGCLPAPGSAGCGQEGDALRLAVPASGPAWLGTARTVRRLVTDAATGALSLAPGDGACLSDGPGVAACTPAPVTGWAGAALVADGEQAFLAAGVKDTLTILPVRADQSGAIAPGTAVVQPKVCGCDPALLLVPGTRDLVVANVGRAAELHFTRGDDGTLTAKACGIRCPMLGAPVAASPDGRSVYATELGSAAGESLGSVFQVSTHDRATTTGLLRYSFLTDVTYVEQEDEVPAQLAVSPDGNWVVTSHLELLARRTAKPPTIAVSGLPGKGRCVKGNLRLKVKVTGARDTGRRTILIANEWIATESGVGLSEHRYATANFTFRYKHRRKRPIEITIYAPGKRFNDAQRSVEFRFC